ncbi:hypothetical protein TEA_010338 [Camellia sinensis var. sinensis]|uniref:Signal peptidase complex catalytic subunit SEC11 n=1 Tax=Camellia sinensis var. sinensis TaxID=542762 RepID=A0A4S4DB29_CAMSN|nr:hypothetical protein TEA_010338 [Camellia sinensis var. sinensis]
MQRSWCNSKKKKSTIERTMGLIGETTVVDSIKSIQFRQAFSQAVTLGIIVASALIIWKTLMCITGSQSPIVVVLSESMEPAFQRGDILFLHMSKDPIRVGEIVVFDVEGRDIPIVHRVIKVHERQDTGEVDVLTKGPDYIVMRTSRDTPDLHGVGPYVRDHNLHDDRRGGLYAPGQLWIQQHHILGRAVGDLDPTAVKIPNLEKQFKKAQGLNFIPDIDDGYTEAGVRLPDIFKMPHIDRFDESGDPMVHIRLFLDILKPMGLTKPQKLSLLESKLLARDTKNSKPYLKDHDGAKKELTTKKFTHFQEDCLDDSLDLMLRGLWFSISLIVFGSKMIDSISSQSFMNMERGGNILVP